MMKKVLAAALALALLAVPCFGEEGTANPGAPAVSVAAPSAVLMTLDGTVLAEKDAHAVREPASVTKVMTLLLVCEDIDSGKIALTDQVTASAYAASMGGSQIWLEEGEVLTVEEMIKCVAVVSANDCAVALAEYLSGSEQAFVQRMNERAAQLGMADTHFVNACGLTAEGHVTSAHDIGLMSAQLLREHPWITQYTTIWQDTIREGASVLVNTNKLLKSYSGITGLKTGFTSSAGYCVSASAEKDGLTLIAVVMGSDSKENRSADAAALLNWGFANYSAVTLTADRPLLPVPVEMGARSMVSVELGRQEPLVLPRAGLGQLEKVLELPQSVPAPVEKGKQLGALSVRMNGQEVCRVPVLACEDVPRLTLWEIFCRNFQCLCFR